MTTPNATVSLKPRPPSSPLKRWLDRTAPFLYRPVRAAYLGLRSWRFRRRYARLQESITARFGWEVQAGPFKGMKYVRQAHCSTLLPKILGTYEAEIQPVIEQAIARQYPLILDLGGAEGYYAVGMALRSPQARVVVYEMEAGARADCRQLANLNGIGDRVEIRECFHAGDAAQFAGQRVFVICDIEGYETEVFGSGQASNWTHADIVVELHDFEGQACRDAVVGGLRTTHRATVFDSRPRREDETTLTAYLPAADRLLAVDEMRPTQQWAYLEAVAGSLRQPHDVW